MPRTRTTSRAEPGRMLGLDGVRAVAILTVLCEHWLPAGHPLKLISAWGTVGVYLFFVLSGFLITGILLDCRQAIEDGHLTRRRALRQFYIRRALRILPAFYLLLAVMALLDLPEVRQTIGWHAAYLSNVYFHRVGAPTGPAGHFWTLAVEEQFYLVWPLAILCLPRRLMPAGIVLTGLAGLALAGAFAYAGRWGEGTLLHGALPYLGGGAVLAMLARRVSACRLAIIGGITLLLAAGLIITCALLQQHLRTIGWRGVTPAQIAAMAAARQLGLVTACGGLVAVVAADVVPGVRQLFSNAPVVHIGRLSYGIYLWHVPVVWILADAAKLLGDSPAGATVWAWSQTLPARLLATYAAAALSWRLLERPLNALKSRFPYRVRPTPPPRPARREPALAVSAAGE